MYVHVHVYITTSHIPRPLLVFQHFVRVTLKIWELPGDKDKYTMSVCSRQRKTDGEGTGEDHCM